MIKRVYIETTIPSFYYEARTEPEMIARHNWTVEWWETQGQMYELVTSVPVIEELQRGNYPNRPETLELISDLHILPIEEEIYEIVDAYIENNVMPKDPRGDALHLALASYHHCNFLIITTPVELIKWEGA
jgi:hypothetical protein